MCTCIISKIQVQTIPTQAARNTRPTERLEQLAEAKKRPDGPFREPEWPVCKKAMKAQSTERTRELSRSKGLVEGFQVGENFLLLTNFKTILKNTSSKGGGGAGLSQYFWGAGR